MTDVVKISSCVDCTITIIGDRFRCPVCHDQHAESLWALQLAAKLASRAADVALSLDLARQKPSIWMPMFDAVLVIIGVILSLLAAKGCL